MQFTNLRIRLILSIALSSLFAVVCGATNVSGEPLQETRTSISTLEKEALKIRTLYIGAEQVDCVGVAPQKCLLVKEGIDDEYTYFYDSIEGFEWQSGYEYELIVAITEVENPPADGSSYSYQLVEVVNQIAVSPEIVDLDGTGWKLRAFSLGDVWREALESREVTLNFANGRISGSAGCNTFIGSYTQNGDQLVISNTGSSLIACEDELAKQETLFLEALETASAISLEENSLWITYGEGVAIVLDRYQIID